MIRNIAALAAATALLSAAAGMAQAQDFPVLNGSGDNAVVEYGAAQPGSVVGGAAVRWSGSGSESRFAYGAVNPQPARIARLQGSREDAEVIYEAAPSVPHGLALGGNAQPRG